MLDTRPLLPQSALLRQCGQLCGDLQAVGQDGQPIGAKSPSHCACTMEQKVS